MLSEVLLNVGCLVFLGENLNFDEKRISLYISINRIEKERERD